MPVSLRLQDLFAYALMLFGLLLQHTKNSPIDRDGFRWRRVLAHHSGSARLWQAFLSWQRARFGSFSCSAMRVSYGDAIIVRT